MVYQTVIIIVNISPLPLDDFSFVEIPVLHKVIVITYYSNMLVNVCESLTKGIRVASRNDKIKMY